ncbi:MAG: RHS repeat-associated core domain-containing protein [Candidatus Contendobacter sp.]|nr:RHS repeat-associated core domain-containing protein [Candidatus Contendobacter sp.]
MTHTLRPWLRIAGLLLVLAGLLTGAARADVITYFHNDPAGSPVVATDANGNLLWKETYRPYGERLLNGARPDTNRLWFTGKPQDPDTGLSYLGARYYSPQLGRFMGIDPKAVDPGDPHSFNRYAYANNNPYKYVDPDGRGPEVAVLFVMVHMAAGAVLGGGTNAAIQYYETGEVQWSGVGGVLDAAGDGAMFGLLGGGAALVTRTTVAKVAEEGAEVVAKTGAKGASGELTTVSGKTYTGNSTGSSASGGDPRAPMHPQTQQALDSVQNPSRTHGHCCEIDAINKALNAGDDVQGAKMGPVRLNESGRTIPACSTCREVKESLGVE